MTHEELNPTGSGDDHEMAQPPMPEVLQVFLQAVEELQCWVEGFDPRQPVTSFHDLQGRLQARFDQSWPSDLKPEEELRKFKNLVAQAVRDEAYVRDLEEASLEPVLADPRLLHLHRLLDECDRVCHGSPIWILDPSMGPAAWSEAQAVLAPLFEGEQASSPEELARRAAEAFLKVSEPYYLTYLRQLVVLMDARRGERRAPGVFKKWRLGSFLKHVADGFPGAEKVVELEVQRIRNAIAHQNIKYDPGTQLLALKNKHGEVTTLPPAALLQKARGMYEVSVLGLEKLRTLWLMRLARRGRYLQAAGMVMDFEDETEVRKAFAGFEAELAQMDTAKSRLKAIPDGEGLK